MYVFGMFLLHCCDIPGCMYAVDCSCIPLLAA